MKRYQIQIGSVPLKPLGLALVMAVFLLVVGCSQGRPASNRQSPPPTANAVGVATPTPIAALPEDLFLEILEPAIESTVSEVPLVVGRTTPDAVVSVDGKTVEVNAQGEFSAKVSLEPGPNVIEVVASDLAGKQKTALLAVILIP